MRARDIMGSPVVGLTGHATIEEAAELMMDRGYTTIPVLTEHGELLGVLTEAELGRARFMPGAHDDALGGGAATGLRPRLVRQVMRPTASVPTDAGLPEVAGVMVNAHQRCLPVLDGGRIVGMISWRDLLAHLVPLH
ncbi:MAG TPA: CBS domain-containing protein [Amycolatopsis sp.]|uniref:CBS domain-containing protein n=1 Tax=Amycolatopsis sp. TaxID=37632 RepID=UPI002B46236E|nr:CBS domain-containing protein [Amycolatopsis sp.]HKS49139.1 CBS domain-containing protein [Amycolatopsis sp.]